MGEENSEDTSALDSTSRDFLESAIRDYNEMFRTNYDTSSDKFQNYYKDISLRMKNREIDLLIVVNMFLTGFDATTLNTLWVDKNLKQHGLVQAFSRTNRILNSIKTFGNIVCFRNLQKRTDDAIALFGDKDAGGICVLKGYKDYYYGDEEQPGYIGLIDELQSEYPLCEPQIIGERRRKILSGCSALFYECGTFFPLSTNFRGMTFCPNAICRTIRDDTMIFTTSGGTGARRTKKKILRMTSYLKSSSSSRWKSTSTIFFCWFKKYHDGHQEDKEILVSIHKALDSSLELRSKKALIETFIAGINDVDDVLLEWREFVIKQKEAELAVIIAEEKLKNDETRKFVERSFHDGIMKTTGTDVDKILPAMTRFDGVRDKKKETVIERLLQFFERFFGIG